jgi:hypothetical protein
VQSEITRELLAGLGDLSPVSPPPRGINRASGLNVLHPLNPGKHFLLPPLGGLGVLHQPGAYPQRSGPDATALDRSSDRRFEFAADTTAKRLEARDGHALDKGFSDFQDRLDGPSHSRVLAGDRWRRGQPAFEDAPARSAHPLLGAVQQFDVIGVRDDLATGTAA